MLDPELAPAAAAVQQTLLTSPSTHRRWFNDEIMRNIIAERVLGLPPDVRVKELLESAARRQALASFRLRGAWPISSLPVQGAARIFAVTGEGCRLEACGKSAEAATRLGPGMGSRLLKISVLSCGVA